MQHKLLWAGIMGCAVALGGCVSMDQMGAIAAQQHMANHQHHQVDPWEAAKAANEADSAQRRADMQRTMNSGSGSMIPNNPATTTSAHCTTSTTSQQTSNAGSATSTTTCH